MRLKHPEMKIFIQDTGILNKLQIKSSLNYRKEDVFVFFTSKQLDQPVF